MAEVLGEPLKPRPTLHLFSTRFLMNTRRDPSKFHSLTLRCEKQDCERGRRESKRKRKPIGTGFEPKELLRTLLTMGVDFSHPPVQDRALPSFYSTKAHLLITDITRTCGIKLHSHKMDVQNMVMLFVRQKGN